MLIAQITDTHIRAGGAKAFGNAADTTARLRSAVTCLLALTPRPDVVLATGDLVDTGGAEDYRQLLELLAPLPMPVLPIPGNHDLRSTMRDAFPAIAKRLDTPYFQYAIDDYPVRLVAIDTTEPGRTGGVLCAERLAWIDATLGASSKPTVLFMHHPPFDGGATPNPDMRCENGEALAAVVAKHPHVEAVLCGHLHRSLVRRWGGTVAVTAPATAPALEFRADGSSPEHWVDTPPMLALHVWREGGELITHAVAADETAHYRALP